LQQKNANLKPRIACEFSPTRLIAARSTNTRNAVEVYTSRAVPRDAVRPSVLLPNINNPAALTSELQNALSAVSGRQRDVSVVIPDASVRVTILDFDRLPATEEEARAVVRLRFRRNVPFEVEDAAVSFQRLPSTSIETRVLAVAMPKNVLQGYESVVREAGFTPGIVIPATLAALGAVDVSVPRMLVRHVPATVPEGVHSTTIVIASGNDILLYRTIEGTGVLKPEAALEDVYPSLVFYEDNYGAKLDSIYIDGIALSDEVRTSLQQRTGVTIRMLETSEGQNLAGDRIPGGALAPVVGVLIG
jgi:type IV pilus assembly protein PilM